MKIIDLSKTIKNDMEIYPGDPKVEIKKHSSISSHGYSTMKITIGTHTGTHVDSFNHMHKNEKSIDEIDLSRFFGKSRVLSKSDNFPECIGLFFIEEISVDFLEKLLKSNPKFVGGNITEGLEKELLRNNIITYTDLINLDLLGANDFVFYGFPLKIKDGDGSPVRALAIT